MEEIVYISAHLSKDISKSVMYGKIVYEQLYKIPNLKIIEIQNHNKNLWCRDYMPISGANGKLVQFQYAPSYMMDSEKWKKHIPDTKKIHQVLHLDCDYSKIILDGGAIEVFKNKAIVSDRVFRDNSKLKEEDVIEEIKNILDLKQLIIIPQYPYDFTGHVDGLVRFINEKEVIVGDLNHELKEARKDKNDYRRKLIENWVYAFKAALWNAGLKLHELPSCIPEKAPPKSAEGVYVNFLKLNDLILMPSYNSVNDDKAKEILKKAYNKEVIKIQANELSREGGMINCVTWTK